MENKRTLLQRIKAMDYKQWSLIQAVFIALAGISVGEVGSDLAQLGEEGVGGFLNKLLKPLPGGTFHFWAFCFLVVAGIQVIKAMKFNDWFSEQKCFQKGFLST